MYVIYNCRKRKGKEGQGGGKGEREGKVSYIVTLMTTDTVREGEITTG